jgi:hypothetical protein
MVALGQLTLLTSAPKNWFGSKIVAGVQCQVEPDSVPTV